ncbi:hypothetical protein [Glaciecola sp. 1036]|uniref:hypothetical protein n=1 Tax=Alteromonadaceae TaxID=72275 RepID=UPI003D0685F5
MTQQKGYTTFEASNFESKTLSDCSVLIVDDEQSTQLVLGSILGEIIQVHCLSDSMQAV